MDEQTKKPSDGDSLRLNAKVFVDDEIPAPSLVPMTARVTTVAIERTLELGNVVRRWVSNIIIYNNILSH